MDGTEIERLIVRLVGDASAYIKMLEDSASKTTEKADEIAKEAERLAKSFSMQSATLGMTGRQAQIYRLQMAGATDSQLANARATEEQLTHFEQQRALMARGAQVTQSVTTAQERHAEQTRDLNRLYNSGAISQETFRRATERARRELEATAAPTQGLGQNLLAFSGTIVASLSALGGMRTALGNFQEAELIGLRLNAVLEANGRDVEKLTDDYNEFAVALEKITTQEDDAVLAMLGVAETFGVTAAAAKDAVKNAVAVAAVTGGEAQSLIRLTAAIERGDVAMAMHMARMVPQLRGIKDETEFLNKYQALVATGMGQARKEMESSSSQLKVLHRDWGNLLEDFGKVVAEGIRPVVTWLLEAIKWFRGLSDTLKSLVAQFVVTIALVTSLAGALTLLRVASGLFTPMGLAVGLVTAAFFGLKWMINNASEDMRDLNKELANMLKARDSLSTASAKKTTDFLEKASTIEDPGLRKEAIKKELDSAEADLERKKGLLAAAKKLSEEMDAEVFGGASLTNHQLAGAGGVLGTIAGGANGLPWVRKQISNLLGHPAGGITGKPLADAERDIDDAAKAVERLGAAFRGIDVSARGLGKAAALDMTNLLTDLKKKQEELGKSPEQVRIDKALGFPEAAADAEAATEALRKFEQDKSRDELADKGRKLTNSLMDEAAAWNSTALELGIYQAASTGLIGSQRDLERALARVKNQAEIAKLAAAGASQADIENARKAAEAVDKQREKFDLLKEANKIIQDTLTPTEKLAQEQARLAEVFNGTDLSATAYARALEKAADAAGKLQGRQAALAGSAEAVSRVMEYQDSLRYGERVNRTARVAEAQKAGGAEGLRIAAEQRDKLKEIKEVLERIAAKPAGAAASAGTTIIEGALLVGAGLAGGG